MAAASGDSPVDLPPGGGDGGGGGGDGGGGSGGANSSGASSPGGGNHVKKRRKISMPWFRQSSFGMSLARLRLPKQHTIATSEDAGATPIQPMAKAQVPPTIAEGQVTLIVRIRHELSPNG